MGIAGGQEDARRRVALSQVRVDCDLTVVRAACCGDQLAALLTHRCCRPPLRIRRGRRQPARSKCGTRSCQGDYRGDFALCTLREALRAAVEHRDKAATIERGRFNGSTHRQPHTGAGGLAPDRSILEHAFVRLDRDVVSRSTVQRRRLQLVPVTVVVPLQPDLSPASTRRQRSSEMRGVTKCDRRAPR